jgi:hypothetical protein
MRDVFERMTTDGKAPDPVDSRASAHAHDNGRTRVATAVEQQRRHKQPTGRPSPAREAMRAALKGGLVSRTVRRHHRARVIAERVRQ